MGIDVLKKIFYSNSNSHIRQKVAKILCSVFTCVTGDDEEPGSLRSLSCLLISSFSLGLFPFSPALCFSLLDCYMKSVLTILIGKELASLQ